MKPNAIESTAPTDLLEEEFRLSQIEHDRILEEQIAQGWGGVEQKRIPAYWREVRGPESPREVREVWREEQQKRKVIKFCPNHPDRAATKRGMCNACYQRWLVATNPKYARRQHRRVPGPVIAAPC